MISEELPSQSFEVQLTHLYITNNTCKKKPAVKAQHRILEKWDFKAGNRGITVFPVLIDTPKSFFEINTRHFKSGAINRF